MKVFVCSSLIFLRKRCFKESFENMPIGFFSKIVVIERRTKIKKCRFWTYFPQIFVIDRNHSNKLTADFFLEIPHVATIRTIRVGSFFRKTLTSNKNLRSYQKAFFIRELQKCNHNKIFQISITTGSPVIYFFESS